MGKLGNVLAVANTASGPIQGMLNRRFQKKQNALDRQFTLDMYQRQYQDNLNLWNMQNDYNSPAAQMQRYSDAGLNPHLIYGQTNESPTIKSPEPKQFTQPAGLISGLDTMFSGYAQLKNVDNLQAQTNNLKKAWDVMNADEMLKLIKAKNDEVDLGIKNEIRDLIVEQTKVALEKQKADTQFTLDSNTRADLANQAEILQKAAQTKLTEAQTEQLNKTMAATIRKAVSDADYAKIEAALAKKGFMKGDTYDTRVLAEIGSGLGAGKTVAEIIKMILAIAK